jgi:endonuclease/exonuclease/phosphatase family metal-dependent hydrolase
VGARPVRGRRCRRPAGDRPAADPRRAGPPAHRTEPRPVALRVLGPGQCDSGVAPAAGARSREAALNPRRFRAAQSRALELGPIARLAWAKERRIVQALRVEAPGGRTYLVANLHCTSYPADERLADAELLRAAWFAVSTAAVDDVVVLAGDFNVRAARSRTLRDLASPEWGFSESGPGIDHILVRGAPSSALRRWPDEQRQDGEHLLSDHAPVEVEIT